MAQYESSRIRHRGSFLLDAPDASGLPGHQVRCRIPEAGGERQPRRARRGARELARRRYTQAAPAPEPAEVGAPTSVQAAGSCQPDDLARPHPAVQAVAPSRQRRKAATSRDAPAAASPARSTVAGEAVISRYTASRGALISPEGCPFGQLRASAPRLSSSRGEVHSSAGGEFCPTSGGLGLAGAPKAECPERPGSWRSSN